MSTSSIQMDDYRIRHPIVLANDARVLDVFPSQKVSGLDTRTAGAVRQFAQTYRSLGEGPINVLVPSGGAVGPTRSSIEAIKHELAASGANVHIRVGSYPVVDPSLAAPVRLTYLSLKARVATPCGDWPSDLASGSTIEGWQNKPYWNYGCATQTALAAQVADPRDLVTPHAETPPDTLMRSRGIESVRKGVDPSTDWKIKNSNISSVGGGN